MAALLYQWFLLSFLPFGMPAGPHPYAGRSGAAAHPFYVSVTEVNHNSKEGTLEISCKIFADDMEDVLKQNYKKAVDLTDARQQAQNNQLVSDYIQKHLSIAADGRGQRLAYVGFEKEAESVYCYFEVTGLPAVKKIDLTNSILQDFTDKQINILHVVVGGNRKSHKLDYPHKQASFSF